MWPRDESLLEASESASAFLTLPPFNPQLSVLFKIIIYLLHQVLVVAHRIFRCILWDLVPRLGIQLGPLALEAWSFSRWTTRESPLLSVLNTDMMLRVGQPFCKRER